MKRTDITNAWALIRKIDQTIPDEVLDFMKDAALAAIAALTASTAVASNETFGIKDIVWKETKSKYSSGKDAFLGKIRIGSYNYNGIDRAPELKYVAHCQLPSLTNQQLGKFPTEELAAAEVERVVKIWLKEISK